MVQTFGSDPTCEALPGQGGVWWPCVQALEEKGRESGAAGIQEGGPGTYVGSEGTGGRVCMDLQLKRRDVKAAGGGGWGGVESTVIGEKQHRSLQQGAQGEQEAQAQVVSNLFTTLHSQPGILQLLPPPPTPPSSSPAPNLLV